MAAQLKCTSGIKKRLVLIVGLQKSGGTLLARLLEHTAVAANPFFGEGHRFWGNSPWSPPGGFPAGLIYHRSSGEMGHEITVEDATVEVREVLNQRLAEAPVSAPITFNKNPFNTVRLRWLREIFPDSLIVATVRRPVPNVFSLTKKYVSIQERAKPWYREGWYGVKPRRWRSLLDNDKVTQCAHQWLAINQRLWDDRCCLDMIVSYHRLCADPHSWVERIISAASGAKCEVDPGCLPRLRCFDDEYGRGSRILSKNTYFEDTGDLDIPEDEPIEFPPMKAAEVEKIEHICGQLAFQFETPIA